MNPYSCIKKQTLSIKSKCYNRKSCKAKKNALEAMSKRKEILTTRSKRWHPIDGKNMVTGYHAEEMHETNVIGNNDQIPISQLK